MLKNSQNISLVSSNVLKLFLISFIFFTIRWGSSFYFLNEDLLTKILFESISDGSFFYPLIKFLSNMDFNNSLNPLITSLNAVPMPFGSVVIHTFFYKIFGLLGLIVVDFFGIFLFLLIFYKIFLKFNTKENSIFYTLLLFSIPLILNIYFKEFNNLPFSQWKNFYNLRVHRPFPASLYFFAFIYLILVMNADNIFKKKYFFVAGVLMSLSFSSWYYFFITEGLLLMLFLLTKLKGRIFKSILKNYKCYLTLMISFFIVSLPFFINLFFLDKDVTESAGIFNLTPEIKLFLLNYYFDKLLTFQFVVFNAILIFLIYFFNKKNINNYQIINIFYLIYLSAFLAPFCLIIFSPKVGLLRHFNDNIVIYGILLLFITLIVLIQNRFKINFNSKFFLSFLTFVFLTNIFFEIDIKKYSNKNRYEFNKIVEIIKAKNIDKELNSILTFDQKFMVWAILNDRIDYLNLTMVGMTAKNHNLIENDLINTFKFFHLNSNDFLIFLKNEKKGWRYLNPQVGTFFLARYTANSLFTFKNSLNFTIEEKNFILKSSPMYHQQLVIPKEEFLRLKNKFDTTKIKNFNLPKIIILNNNLSFIKDFKLDENIYCNAFKGSVYSLFISKDKNINCDINSK